MEGEEVSMNVLGSGVVHAASNSSTELLIHPTAASLTPR